MMARGQNGQFTTDLQSNLIKFDSKITYSWQKIEVS
jgi:hypothetical protein